MNKEIELEIKFGKISSDEFGKNYWINKLANLEFEVVNVISNEYIIDTYYDTSDLHFLNTDKYLSIRKKESKGLEAIFKDYSKEDYNSTNKEEYKEKLPVGDYLSLVSKFKKYDHLIKFIEEEPKLTTKTNRETIVAKNKDAFIELKINDIAFIDPTNNIVVLGSSISVFIKSNAKKIKEITKKLSTLIIGTGSFEEERFDNYYQKGYNLVKMEQKTKKKM